MNVLCRYINDKYTIIIFRPVFVESPTIESRFLQYVMSFLNARKSNSSCHNSECMYYTSLVYTSYSHQLTQKYMSVRWTGGQAWLKTLTKIRNAIGNWSCNLSVYCSNNRLKYKLTHAQFKTHTTNYVYDARTNKSLHGKQRRGMSWAEHRD